MLWVRILNRALDWSDLETTRAELARLDADARLDAAGQAQLQRDVSWLRSLFASAALERPPHPRESAAWSDWLRALELRASSVESWAGFELPALRAARASSELPSLLETLLSTALVQMLTAGHQLRAVSRCRGARRDTAMHFDPTDEPAFARQSGLERLDRDDGWRQCARLVHAPRRAQYCSKTCSNVAFVLRKARAEPRYFAAKQQRYRVRQTRPRFQESRAFMFVD